MHCTFIFTRCRILFSYIMSTSLFLHTNVLSWWLLPFQTVLSFIAHNWHHSASIKPQNVSKSLLLVYWLQSPSSTKGMNKVSFPSIYHSRFTSTENKKKKLTEKAACCSLACPHSTGCYKHNKPAIKGKYVNCPWMPHVAQVEPESQSCPLPPCHDGAGGENKAEPCEVGEQRRTPTAAGSTYAKQQRCKPRWCHVSKPYIIFLLSFCIPLEFL